MKLLVRMVNHQNYAFGSMSIKVGIHIVASCFLSNRARTSSPQRVPRFLCSPCSFKVRSLLHSPNPLKTAIITVKIGEYMRLFTIIIDIIVNIVIMGT